MDTITRRIVLAIESDLDTGISEELVKRIERIIKESMYDEMGYELADDVYDTDDCNWLDALVEIKETA